jgi:uncharacterized protein YwbE
MKAPQLSQDEKTGRLNQGYKKEVVLKKNQNNLSLFCLRK